MNFRFFIINLIVLLTLVSCGNKKNETNSNTNSKSSQYKNYIDDLNKISFEVHNLVEANKTLQKMAEVTKSNHTTIAKGLVKEAIQFNYNHSFVLSVNEFENILTTPKFYSIDNQKFVVWLTGKGTQDYSPENNVLPPESFFNKDQQNHKTNYITISPKAPKSKTKMKMVVNEKGKSMQEVEYYDLKVPMTWVANLSGSEYKFNVNVRKINN